MSASTMRRRARLLPSVVACAAIASACGSDGDGGGGDGPELEPVRCQIVWVTVDPPGQESTYDYYVVDAPVAHWVSSGTVSFDVSDPTGEDNVTGAWVDGFDVVSREWEQSAVATSGVFALTVSSSAVAVGAPVEFSDESPQQYYLLDSAGNLTISLGASGTGTFIGEWSDPRSPDVVPGTGNVTITYLGSDMTLGIDSSWAQCFEEEVSFAPLSREERLRRAGDRASEILRR